MYRVSPTEPNPTHHVLLRDRNGREVALILSDEKGNPLAQFNENPVETTALKQTSGSSSYADYDYPYSPIVQDDLSGGRGGLDFERDSTKYYDSFRCKSGRANKAYAGPQEQWPTGLYEHDQHVPGDVTWQRLTGSGQFLYLRFQASGSYTAAYLWLLLRYKGEPNNLSAYIYSDNAGALNAQIDSAVIAYSNLNDILSEWLIKHLAGAGAISSGSYYWVVLEANSADDDDNCWMVGARSGADPAIGAGYQSATLFTNPSVSAPLLYYQLKPSFADQTCIGFEYKEAMYFVISPASGAPQLFIMGDRGVADSNAGQLGRLIDGSKTWEFDEFLNVPVQIIDGLGRLERTPYRLLENGNTATALVNATGDNWTIQQDTTTEYVIHGDRPREITGHGLTAPVTDVLVSTTGVVYFCMGSGVTVRRMREYTNAGTWTREFADEAAGTKADFMVYKPVAKKIVMASNQDAAGDVSVSTMSNVSVPAWGDALTWDAAKVVDSRYRRIMGMIVYPDASGDEAVWVLKTDMPYILGSGDPYPAGLEEMKALRSFNNGKNPLRHGLYLYFPISSGWERFYGNQYDDIGPNLGEGLPANRRGPIVDSAGYPGKYFVAIDAGPDGYSSILDSDGWHERYRAPKGERITMLYYQPTPGACLDRLWIFQGNDLIYLPFPSESVNELEDSAYPYTHEFAITLSRMHAGMFDVMKIVKKIKVQSENLARDTCWLELDYRTNENESWTAFTDAFVTSPTQEIDLSAVYGLSGKRLQFRLRGYTTDASQSPQFLAIIVNAVIRTDVKYMCLLNFRLMDSESFLSNDGEETLTAMQRQKVLKDFADASTDSMLWMQSTSPLYHDRLIFLNPIETKQARSKSEEGNPFLKDVFICRASVQEA